MKLALMLLLAVFAMEVSAAGTKSVRPYVRKDGTYVQGHYRSPPNQQRFDNFGARNSIYGSNPYTEKKGSQRDEFSTPPAYNRPRSNCVPAYGQTGC